MAKTKRETIDRAFREIGVSDYNFDRPVEETNAAKEALDDLCAAWEGVGIDWEYDPTTELDAPTGAPPWADRALELNLAVELAPSIGKQPLAQTTIGARKGYLKLVGYYAKRFNISMGGTLRGGGWKRPNYPFFPVADPESLPSVADDLEADE